MTTLLLSFLLLSIQAFSLNMPAFPATVETEPAETDGDAADDPSVWVDYKNPEKSQIIASDKNFGLIAYGLDGKKLFRFDVGPVNNVDIRQGITWRGQVLSLVGSSNKEHHSLDLHTYDGENLRLFTRVHLPEGKKAYGLCLGFNPKNQRLYALASVKDKGLFVYRLEESPSPRLSLVHSFLHEGTIEGCVVDDNTGTFFFAEEDKGVWKAKLGSEKKEKLVINVDDHGLEADLEGLAIHRGPQGDSLFVSSQGNSSFAVFSLKGQHHMGTFQVRGNLQIDFVTSTDGIEIYSKPLGRRFPNGLLIVQDNENTTKDGGLEKQNFKLVDLKPINEFLLR